MGIGATHIDHVVVVSNDSAATARLFADNLGIEIKRTMSRPGSGAHLEFAKLEEVVLEFAGPGQPEPGAEVNARLGGFVLTVTDIEAAVAHLRQAGISVGDPKPAVQPGALFAPVKDGTHGVPLGLIQYNVLPMDGE